MSSEAGFNDSSPDQDSLPSSCQPRPERARHSSGQMLHAPHRTGRKVWSDRPNAYRLLACVPCSAWSGRMPSSPADAHQAMDCQLRPPAGQAVGASSMLFCRKSAVAPARITSTSSTAFEHVHGT